MKKLITIAMAGILTVSLIGCSAPPAAEAPASEAPAVEQGQEQDQGQEMPKGDDVFGKVKSIVGNEIELEIADPPALVSEGDGELKEGEMEAGAAMVPAMAASTDESTSGGSFAVEGENVEDRSMPKLELKYTGESKSVVIPTGVNITSVTTGEVQLSAIKKGSVLMLTVDDANAENPSAKNITILE